MVDIPALAEAFRHRYERVPRFFRAPGRVNLIGEHTDYNDGFVLPIAIDRETVVAIASRPDRVLRIWSINLNESIQLDLDRLSSGHHGSWRDYVEGTAVALLSCGVLLRGADIALQSDLSIGGGLSSSAALEISLASALVSISGASLDKHSLALAGQTAEHSHVGVHCGIMDQFSSVFAVKNHAILLDCRSLEAKMIPLNLREYCMVICDSRIRHALASSEYNQRRRDCELGVKLLSPVLPQLRSLRDVTPLDLKAHQSVLPTEILKRCRHVLLENDRTLKAAEALSTGHVAEMGRLMSESHQSLKEDYEVSCPELDLLFESAMSQAGVLGARMTGGGFGGCTVNLVERCRFEAFREKVSRDYQAHAKTKPDIFIAEASDGANELK